MTKKRKNKSVIIIMIIFIVMLVLAMPYIREFTSVTSREGEEVTVVIPKGASSEDIGKILKDNDLIRSVNIFKVRVHMSEEGSRMNYGSFNLNKGMCIPDIIKTLAGNYAHRETVMFTVPEGYSVQQIARKAEEAGFCTRDEFLAALKKDYDYDFLKNLDIPNDVDYELQGFLYPETYEFYTDATAEDIINRMLKQFETEIKNVDIPDGRSLYEIVTVASLLERESLLEKEMPVIAGVIYNRLEIGMRLQVDACVQYAVSNGEYNINRVTYDDLQIDSPYNTYKRAGLPAGAISSVSIKAIEAAISPIEHDYFYYHTDNEKNDGSHIFTKTYQEHLATMN